MANPDNGSPGRKKSCSACRVIFELKSHNKCCFCGCSVLSKRQWAKRNTLHLARLTVDLFRLPLSLASVSGLEPWVSCERHFVFIRWLAAQNLYGVFYYYLNLNSVLYLVSKIESSHCSNSVPIDAPRERISTFRQTLKLTRPKHLMT